MKTLRINEDVIIDAFECDWLKLNEYCQSKKFEKVVFEGDFNMFKLTKQCRNSLILPSYFVINGVFYGDNCVRKIHLPSDTFIVNGSAYFRNAKIDDAELPKNFFIKDEYSPSQYDKGYIPDNLVCDKLNLSSNNHISKLPKGLKVNSLSIDFTNINEIPRGTIVRDVLNANNCNLTKLPNNFKCGFISLYGSKILELPNNVFVDVLDIQS